MTIDINVFKREIIQIFAWNPNKMIIFILDISVKLENTVRSSEDLRRENEALLKANQDYKHKLQHCQVTIGKFYAVR